MTRDHLALFPDTNSLLHYPPLADVAWPSVCNAKKVTIVFCMQVIHELDEKKTDPRLSGRAERVIKEIKQIRDSGNVIRDNVLLEIFNQELRVNEFEGSLSPDSADDRIVHLVKKYVATTEQKEVAVYSEDLGMSLRCGAYGIPVIEPDKATRMESPQTEQEKKYKAAITELNALKNQAPVINVRVAGPDDDGLNTDKPFTLELARQVEVIDPNAAAEAERERVLAAAFPTPNTTPQLPSGLASTLAAFNTVSESERRRYEQDVNQYLDAYRKYAEGMNSFNELVARSFGFEIHVSNSGRSPATDLDIVLAFPPVLQFMVAGREGRGHQPNVPEKPKPPKPPRRGLCWPEGIDLGGILRPEPIRIPLIAQRGAPWSEVGGKMDSGFVIRIHIPKLQHHYVRSFCEFRTMFTTWEDARPFEVAATLTAGNLPDKIEWKIPFVIKVAT